MNSIFISTLALLAMLLFPQNAGFFGQNFSTNNIAFVQVCLGYTAGSSAAIINLGASSSFCHNGGTAANPTAGHLVFLYSNSSLSTITASVTDTLSNGYTSGFDGITEQERGYSTLTTGGAADTATLHLSSSPNSATISLEISGQNASQIDAGCAGIYGTTSGTSWSLPSCTSTNASDIIIGCAGANANISYAAGTGYTLPFGQYDGGNAQTAGCVYRIVNSTGTYTPLMTVGTSTSGTGFTIAIKSS